MRVLLSFLLLSFSLNLIGSEKTNFEASDFLSTLSKGDKAAILMVHFGTTFDETRGKTIDAINSQVKMTYPNLEVREAYTSRIVMRRLKARGISKDAPIEALLKLRGEGYTHIIVQSTNIIEGIEMESLRRDVAKVSDFFKEIRIGNPLLYSAQDVEEVVESIAKRHPEKGQLVLVGHGTYTPATATYAMVDYMFKAKGYARIHVGTIEGYPTFDDLLKMLHRNKEKRITLIPFMFVAGDHAANDIAVEWKEALEKDGYQVKVILEGMGEIAEIQQLFVSHINFILKNRMIDIIDKKARYAKETD